MLLLPFNLRNLTRARQNHPPPSLTSIRRRTRPQAMWPFNGLRPRTLEEQGDQYVSDARRLLNNRGAELSPSRRQPAEDLLSEYVGFPVLVLHSMMTSPQSK